MSGTGAETPIWGLEGAAKRTGLREMFSAIAPSYDRVNSLMSLRAHQRWRTEAVRWLQLSEGNSVLDLCCGTGDFVRALRESVGGSGKIIALDFAYPMLEIARSKPGAEACYLSADALSIPCASNAFDAVTIGWGIRNVGDVDRAHREIARVLKPGGRFVSIDMARPQDPTVRRLSRVVLRLALPALGSFVRQSHAYSYLAESTHRFRSREELEDSMRRAGMREVGHSDRMFGNVCIHRGVKA